MPIPTYFDTKNTIFREINTHKGSLGPTNTSGTPEVCVGLTDSCIRNECKKSHGIYNIKY